jgi:hypothetical protein
MDAPFTRNRTDMVRNQHSELARRAFSEIAAAGLSPAGIAEFKLERLLELRAVIDAMRADRNADSSTLPGRPDRRPRG